MVRVGSGGMVRVWRYNVGEGMVRVWRYNVGGGMVR